MGLKKQFKRSMVFEPSEFELVNFDCTNDAKFNNYFKGKWSDS